MHYKKFLKGQQQVFIYLKQGVDPWKGRSSCSMCINRFQMTSWKAFLWKKKKNDRHVGGRDIPWIMKLFQAIFSFCCTKSICWLIAWLKAIISVMSAIFIIMTKDVLVSLSLRFISEQPKDWLFPDVFPSPWKLWQRNWIANFSKHTRNLKANVTWNVVLRGVAKTRVAG